MEGAHAVFAGAVGGLAEGDMAEAVLNGVVETDDMALGGKPQKDPGNPDARQNKQGYTTKTPALVAIQRPGAIEIGMDQHDSVNHGRMGCVWGMVHAIRAEGFNDRIRRTVVDVYHHISQKHIKRFLHEETFRWNQRVRIGTVTRTTCSGWTITRRVYYRVPSIE
ncbi:transposase [Ferruginivarius sediminum]|uniref:ISXO2-like transposase domain-containing protein n=1 Tax=Ferruginivarius sediminum TaxID=2661937 RepID=A0A369T7T1_9PROT|nr:transposase [Ferruginivarius sediminum]RDD60942.1 hypothetical protein DRB17_15240 [Ferruginivarius sediminum]